MHWQDVTHPCSCPDQPRFKDPHWSTLALLLICYPRPLDSLVMMLSEALKLIN